MNLVKERMSSAHTTLICNCCAVRRARVAGCSIEFPSIVASFSICVVDDSVAAISAKEVSVNISQGSEGETHQALHSPEQPEPYSPFREPASHYGKVSKNAPKCANTFFG
jgi:hypothetical protein